VDKEAQPEAGQRFARAGYDLVRDRPEDDDRQKRGEQAKTVEHAIPHAIAGSGAGPCAARKSARKSYGPAHEWSLAARVTPRDLFTKSSHEARLRNFALVAGFENTASRKIVGADTWPKLSANSCLQHLHIRGQT